MSRSIFVNMLLALCCLACSGQDGGLLIRSNLPVANEPYRVIFEDSAAAYIVGRHRRTDDFRKLESVIFRANKDEGLVRWEQFSIPVPGYTSSALVHNGAILMVNHVYTNRYSLAGMQTFLLKIDMQSGVLDTLFSFGSEFVKSIHLLDNNMAVAFVHSNGTDAIKLTTTGGTDWRNVHGMNGIFVKSIIRGNKVYVLMTRKDAVSASIFSYDVSAGNVAMVVKNVPDCEDFLIDDRGKMWLIAGHEPDDVRLYTLLNNRLKTVRRFPHSAKAIFAKDNRLVVLMRTVDETMMGGLGGTKYSLEVSPDYGKTWTNVKLPDDTYVRPYHFTADGQFIAYSGRGHLTWIDLSSPE